MQTIAAAVSILLFAAFGYGFYNYRSLTANQHTTAVAGLGAGTSSNTTAGPTDTSKGSAENILVVGLDSRAGLTNAQKRFYKVGQGDVSFSTDTIIVVHVPADGSRATLLSIPRDTYVQIPGFGGEKINAAFANGYYNSGGKSAAEDERLGAGLLVRVVKQLTGLEIDHYVQVGFSGFVDIVKAIHTVPIDLCESVDDTHKHDEETGVGGGSGFKEVAGHHDLTPQQALEFVRQRHNIPGPDQDDIGREARQRYFLKQAFGQIASAGVLLNPIKLKNLISAVDGAFTFDNNNFGILQFAEQMSQLTSNKIVGQSIKTIGTKMFPYPVGQATLVDLGQVHQQAHDLFYGSSSSHKRNSQASSSLRKSKNSDPAASGCIY